MLAFCSTSRMVVPCWFSSRTMSKICSTRMGARPMDGSSSMSRLGFDISARPMASICCSPPDRVPAIWFCRSFRRGKRWYTSAILSSYSLVGRVNAPICRFSSTVICRKICRPSGTRARPMGTILWAGMPPRSLPINWTEPVREDSSPATVFRMVDLPAPLAPMRVTTSPSLTSKETPLMAWMAP